MKNIALHALAAGARTGVEADVAAALNALPRVDPVAYWLAQRHIKKSLRRAWLDVSASERKEAAPHALHLAYLYAAGRKTDAATQNSELARQAFAAADANTDTRTPSSLRWLTPLLAVIILGAVGTGIWAALPTKPAVASKMGSALTEVLTDWVVVLDRYSRLAVVDAEAAADSSEAQELAALRARLTDETMRDELGEAGVTAMATLLDRTKELACDPDIMDTYKARNVPFRAALRDFNRILKEREQPFFIDGDWMIRRKQRAQTSFFVFEVHARHPVSDGLGTTVDAVHLKRVDRLNWERSLLGYTRKTMDVAVILRDKVEHQLVTYVGPALMNNAPMPLIGREARRDWEKALEQEAGRITRESFERVLPDDLEELRDFGALLEQRRDLAERWSERLGKRGMRFRVPGTLAIDDDTFTALKESLPDFQVRELEDLQRKIEGSGNTDVFRRLMERFAKTVEQHEVQHRLDYTRGDDFPVAPGLKERLERRRPKAESSLTEAEAARLADAHDQALERANFELSAYLSEIGREPDFAKLNLTLSMSHIFGGSRSAEWYSTTMILDGLAEEFGLRIRTTRGDDGPVKIQYAADVYLALSARPDSELVAAAKRLWARWYGQPLPDLTVVAD